MKIYIAGHNQEKAIEIANLLTNKGYEITSTWLTKPFKRTEQHSVSERVEIANEDVIDVLRSDALLLISSTERVPGGKFVEAGVAIGSGKPIFLIGHRENMLMWHKSIMQFDSLEEFLKADLKPLPEPYER